ncbi:MAG: hypothetical protein SOT80_10785 [Candidatus Pseudoruminococcus sp.]|nr:hypothetical protein [Ruminococcus sp.]MDY2783862.1 hypothetical protein [Candidatus Pseudoruminococcus sp.]
MKNENSKGSFFLLLSMISFFIMSATFLVMPLIQTDIDSGNNAYSIIIGITFWLTLVFGIISLFLARKNIQGIENIKKGIGLIKFFQNKIAAIFDILLIISIIGLIILTIVTDGTLYICYIFFSAVTFSFIMHCILNGKIFNCLIINKKRSEV